MAQENSAADSPCQRFSLLRDRVQLVRRKNSDRYEIVRFQEPLTFDKGFFAVILACQMLAQKNEGIIVVGVAGASGSGKTVFTEKVLNFMPDIAVLSMDNYNDVTRIIDGNFDDPRLTDYDTLLENIQGLKEGRPVQVPIYDFKTSSRVGYRTVEVPSARIVIIEGIYALNEKLRPLLDLRVSVTGGIHFDLVKRVLRDIQRAGQEPEEIIHQISETVYPMYKAFIEPDLQTAHIKITNKFNPFTGFQNPTYVLKSSRNLSVDQIKAVIPKGHMENMEEIYDIYLLPPGEDPEVCQSYLRMQNRDGRYNLMFEEWVTDNAFIISPRISFGVSVRLLGGLMALGYTIAAILKRSSHIFVDEKFTIKIDWLEQLNRRYVQVQGRDRQVIKHVAEQLGLDGSYIARTYIEQIQLEKLMDEVIALPDDLKTKLSLDEEMVSSPREVLSKASTDRLAIRNSHLRSGMSHSYSARGDRSLSNLTRLIAADHRRSEGTTFDLPAVDKGFINHLSEQISTLNERIDVFISQIEALTKLVMQKSFVSQHNLAFKGETCNGSAPTSIILSGLENGTSLPTSSSSSQSYKELPTTEEIVVITRGQRQIIHQLDNLSKLVHKQLSERTSQRRDDSRSRILDKDLIANPLILVIAFAGFSIFLFKGLYRS